MYKVICCVCKKTMYWKKGWVAGVSHSFCPSCMAKYRKDNDLPPQKISPQEDVIITMDQVKEIFWGAAAFLVLLILIVVFMCY